ncbi:MAG: hypothetical protein AB1430_10195 [Pseudomonadota bacterium]
MTEPRTPEQVNERLEAKADRPEDRLPTYQELLDEAVDETFPASDPISPTAAMNAERPLSTRLDSQDWKLKPAQSAPAAEVAVVAEFDDEAAARHARDEVLASDLPTARLELPPRHSAGPAATLTVLTCDEPQRLRAMEIVRRSGAAHVACRP